MSLPRALAALQIHVSVDSSYVPVKDPKSQRWVVTTTAATTELLVTGAKWYDTRARRGGGGCVDLVMHLLGLDFVAAVKQLSLSLAAAGDRPGAGRDSTAS